MVTGAVGAGEHGPGSASAPGDPATGLQAEDGMSGFLANYPVSVEIPVAWGEMDAFGHVNNTVFFRYFESVRVAYFERVGFTGGTGRGIGPILASTSCRFRRPLFYPDTVRVGARATELGEDRFGMAYRVVSLRSEEVAAEGEGLVVSYDYSTREKAALPAGVRRAIRELEGWGSGGGPDAG
jgi:acyl-CoA thioester hydrolase